MDHGFVPKDAADDGGALQHVALVARQAVDAGLQQGGQGGGLFGFPLNEVANGAWDSTSASLIAGDWQKAIVGVRQDISFKVFDQGVVSDGSGNVVLNLMQQDSVALRVTMRLGFSVANPVTAVESSALERAPFAVLKPGT